VSVDRRFKIVFFVVVLLVLFGFGGWYQFLREDVDPVGAAQDTNQVASQAVAEATAPAKIVEPVVEEPAPPATPAVEEPAPLAAAVQQPVEQPATAVSSENAAIAPEPSTVLSEPSTVEVVTSEEPAAGASTVAEPVAQVESPTPAPTSVEVAESRVVASAPSFDVFRVEPTGEAVIAGRSEAGAVVELVRNGVVFDRIVADASGNFVFIPKNFPAGASEVGLRLIDKDGTVVQSEQSVTVVVADDLRSTPMVAIAAPNQPTVLLSRPEELVRPAETARPAEAAAPVESAASGDAPAATVAVAVAPSVDAPAPDASAVDTPAIAAPATEPASETEPQQVAVADSQANAVATAAIRIASVEAETGGGLYVTGEAGPLANVRLYLNDTFVAPAEAAADGTVSFSIERGVRPGTYRVRLDEVTRESGTVLSRAEVVFEVPELVAAVPSIAPVVPVEPEPASNASSDTITAVEAPVAVAQPVAEPATTVAAPEAPAAEPSTRSATTTIPEIATAVVTRGDSLWRISRAVYGRGIRYTEIFAANQDQIRNPNRIYPGQLFVLPPDQEREGETAGARAN